jgi:hypothetical protein
MQVPFGIQNNEPIREYFKKSSQIFFALKISKIEATLEFPIVELTPTNNKNSR